MKEHNCRVCGLYTDDLLWDDNGNPGYVICLCCGVESGYEDYTVESIKRYREKWISNGAKWFVPQAKPEKWVIQDQLENISKEFL